MSDILSEFFTEATKPNVSAFIDPQGIGHTLKSYIKGTARLNVSSNKAYVAINNDLRALWKAMGRSTAGESIWALCTRKGSGTIMAPRSTEAITIVPDVGAMFYTKDTTSMPTLYMSNIIAMAQSDKNTPEPDPNGVIVSFGGSDLYASKSKGIVKGMYPPQASGNVPMRWYTTPAPSWFSNIMYDSQASVASGSTKTVSDKDIVTLCNNYAKDIYYRLRYQNSSCTVDIAPNCITAYEALGATCRIEYAPGKYMTGRLDSYGLKYAMSASGGSSMNVTVTFTHVHPWDDSDIVDRKNTLYIIDDGDIITEFPDILGRSSNNAPENADRSNESGSSKNDVTNDNDITDGLISGPLPDAIDDSPIIEALDSFKRPVAVININDI